MHSCPGIRLAIGRAVVYHARAAHAFSAGIRCRHCRVYTEVKLVNAMNGQKISKQKKNNTVPGDTTFKIIHTLGNATCVYEHKRSLK